MTRPEGNTKILVVGGGIAGLSFAIDARLKGYDVRVIERRSSFEEFSDVVVVQLPALCTPNQWPGFKERLDQIAMSQSSRWWRHDGSLISKFTFALGDQSGAPVIRSAFHLLLRDYAKEMDIPISHSVHVKEYFEDNESAGVALADGSQMTADVVVAADGWHTHSRELIPSQLDAKPKSSGYSVFCAAFPVERALDNAVINDFLGSNDEIHIVLGYDVHGVIGRSEKVAYWTLTRREAVDESDKSRSGAEHQQKAFELVKDRLPVYRELILTSKPEEIIDWPLMWRDPRPDWSTPGGRVIQIGDAARPYLPTSGSGATMAMEDAFTLATVLHKGGIAGIPLAGKIYNTLRFERTTAVQRFGFTRRQVWHRTDWSKFVMDENTTTPPATPYWIMNHDPAQYALDHYEEACQAVLNGNKFEASNSVPGYTYKPWTVDGFMAIQDRGEWIQDEGDWNS